MPFAESPPIKISSRMGQIKDLDMDDILATRKWITHQLESRGASIKIDCNVTMREILEVMEWPEPGSFGFDLLLDIVAGSASFASALYVAILNSLARNSIPFVCINLIFTYVGLILGG